MEKIKVHEKKPADFLAKVEIAAVYVNINDKILLLECSSNKSECGAWGVPAGKFERGETPVHCAKRELFEETGIVIAAIDSFFSMGQLYISKPGIDYIYHAFAIDLDSIPIICLSCEHSSYKWVSRQEAERLPLMKGGEQALDYYYRNRVKE